MLTAQLVGRLGADPTQKNVANSTVTECSLAVEQRNGKTRTTEWVSIEIWGKSGAALAGYGRKGDSIFAAGEVSLERWQGRDGQSKSKLKMRCDRWEFAGSKRNEGDLPQERQKLQEPIDDEEIPF